VNNVSVSTRPGAGADGSDRVTVLLLDDLVKNTWLQVTVLPGERTGLAAPHVFYFGNLVGETGDGTGTFRVGALDLAAVKRALNQTVPVTSAVDFDHDGRVTALDLAAARANLNRTLPRFAAPGPGQPRPAVLVAPQPARLLPLGFAERRRPTTSAQPTQSLLSAEENE
jgi:hypothetical protein